MSNLPPFPWDCDNFPRVSHSIKTSVGSEGGFCSRLVKVQSGKQRPNVRQETWHVSYGRNQRPNRELMSCQGATVTARVGDMSEMAVSQSPGARTFQLEPRESLPGWSYRAA